MDNPRVVELLHCLPIRQVRVGLVGKIRFEVIALRAYGDDAAVAFLEDQQGAGVLCAHPADFPAAAMQGIGGTVQPGALGKMGEHCRLLLRADRLMDDEIPIQHVGPLMPVMVVRTQGVGGRRHVPARQEMRVDQAAVVRPLEKRLRP